MTLSLLTRAVVNHLLIAVVCFVALLASFTSGKADESAALFFVRPSPMLILVALLAAPR